MSTTPSNKASNFALALTDSSTSERQKKDYKQVQELLLLHRRFEKNAARLFRKGLTETTIEEKKCRAAGNGTSPVSMSTELSAGFKDFYEFNNPTRKTHKEGFSKRSYLNDKAYSEQLLFRDDYSGSFVDGFSPSCVENNNLRRENTLRLPKLEGIPPENKSIFYTTLPKMPSLPKVKESRVKGKTKKKKKRNSSQTNHNRSNAFSSDSCLTIRQLPSDHFMLRDGSINGANSTPVPIFSGMTPPLNNNLSPDDGRLWLVPLVNIEIPPYRMGNSSDDREYSTMEETREDTHSVRKNTQEDSRPAYKRNVHFSEFLHEIHLYSPVSTLSSKSK